MLLSKDYIHTLSTIIYFVSLCRKWKRPIFFQINSSVSFTKKHDDTPLPSPNLDGNNDRSMECDQFAPGSHSKPRTSHPHFAPAPPYSDNDAIDEPINSNETSTETVIPQFGIDAKYLVPSPNLNHQDHQNLDSSYIERPQIPPVMFCFFTSMRVA